MGTAALIVGGLVLLVAFGIQLAARLPQSPEGRPPARDWWLGRTAEQQASRQRAQDKIDLHPDRVSTWFLRYCRQLGLAEIGVHGLRHSYATAALRAGVSPHVVSKRLGHASVAITLEIYAHVFVYNDVEAAGVAAAVILGADRLSVVKPWSRRS